MKTFVKAFSRGLIIAGGMLLLLCFLVYAAGARVNTTQSIPVGLYWTSSAPLAKYAYVIFCPPPTDIFDIAKKRGYITSGFCPGSYGYLMKQVLAVGGATVTVTDTGVLVDGERLPHSAPLSVDPAGRPLPRHQADRYTLRISELLLMSNDSALSFDGRYFGPIDRSQVESVIHPVIIW